MKYERLWERLLEFLNQWSAAVEITPGRLEVAVLSSDGSTTLVEILMTRDEWDDMVTTPWGNFDDAAREVREAVLGLRGNERFLIFGDYELVPSATRTLPIDPEEARLQELARQNPGGFRWVAEDEDGNALDELRPPAD